MAVDYELLFGSSSKIHLMFLFPFCWIWSNGLRRDSARQLHNTQHKIQPSTNTDKNQQQRRRNEQQD